MEKEHTYRDLNIHLYDLEKYTYWKGKVSWEYEPKKLQIEFRYIFKDEEWRSVSKELLCVG